MRLVLIGPRAVWAVLAIANEAGRTVWDELEAADPSDTGAERMRATLATEVPLNGPPRMNRTKCRDLGNGIYEFKEPGVRVLWFYDAGRIIVCTHSSPKVSSKEFQPEIARARRLRNEYAAAKLAGKLQWPEGLLP